MDMLLRIIAGTTSDLLNNTGADGRIWTGVTNYDVGCVGGYPTVNTSTDTATWQFVFGPGVAGGLWDNYDFILRNGTGGWLLRDGSTGTTGNKGANDTWTVTYQFSI